LGGGGGKGGAKEGISTNLKGGKWKKVLHFFKKSEKGDFRIKGKAEKEVTLRTPLLSKAGVFSQDRIGAQKGTQKGVRTGYYFGEFVWEKGGKLYLKRGAFVVRGEGGGGGRGPLIPTSKKFGGQGGDEGKGSREA